MRSKIAKVLAAAGLSAAILAASVAAAAPTVHEVYRGYAMDGVHDGDTFSALMTSALCGKVVRQLRLGGVDCPEKDQPWGDVARQRTLELVQGQALVVELTGAVTYGRPVARVWLPDGRELGEVLVDEGLAWADPRYAKGERGRALKALMEFAKAQKRGLWADENPIPPWVWRKKK